MDEREPRSNGGPLRGPRPAEPAAPDLAPEEHEFAGPGLLQIIWHGRWIVLGVTVLCLALAFAYITTATPIFESTARVYVQQKGPTAMSREDGGFMTESRNYLYTQAEVFKSIDLLTEILEDPDVSSMKTFMGVKTPVLYLKESVLDVNVGKKDEILTVSARSPYPTDANTLVHMLVVAYKEFHSAKKRGAVGQVIKLLEGQRKTEDKHLGDIEAERIELKEKAGLLSFRSENENVIVRKAAMLMDALAKAELDRVEAETRLAMFDDLGDESSPLVLVGDPGMQTHFYTIEREFQRSIRELEDALDVAKEELRALRVEFTSECPAVRVAEARIARTEEDLEEQRKERKQLRAEYINAARVTAQGQAEAARRAEAALRTKYEEFEATAREAIVLQARIEKLDSDVERARENSRVFAKRLGEMDVEEDTGGFNIEILEKAKPGTKPVAPQKARIMAIALVLGLMLGAGLAFLRDQLNHRFRSSEEMAAVLAAPVLGVVPHVKSSKEVFGTGQRVHLDPHSIDAEAYRTIRTAIYYNALTDKSNVLLVTSPTSGDGKTTVTSNLAIAMAQVGQKILILDADLRRPSQNRVFGMSGEAANGATLASVLAGEHPVDDLIRPAPGIEGLDVLPCLSRISNPGETLNSPEFATMLEELTQRYDRVVIDSPPVMPVADARILSTLCDAVIVVLRAEKTGRKVAQLTREGLLSVGARILGAVVNDVPKGKGGHGHYGYYGGGYGQYGYGDRKYTENQGDEDIPKRRHTRRGSRGQAASGDPPAA